MNSMNSLTLQNKKHFAGQLTSLNVLFIQIYDGTDIPPGFHKRHSTLSSSPHSTKYK